MSCSKENSEGTECSLVRSTTLENNFGKLVLLWIIDPEEQLCLKPANLNTLGLLFMLVK